MANEKRLIDADALSEELSTLTMTITGLRAGKGVLREFMMEYRKSVLRIVDEQPTVEAVPVVHGRWYAVDEDCEELDGETESRWWGCTNCHEIVEYDDYIHIQRLSPYCPNCGANMRGAEDGKAD